jgi:hypothetical protein
LDQVRNFLNAHFFAQHIGRTLKAHITIQLHAAPGFTGAAVHLQREFVSEMMKAIRWWITNKTGQECHWAWVMENDANKRLHMHLHTNLSRDHFAKLRDFLKKFRDLNGQVFGAPVWTSYGMDDLSDHQLAAMRRYPIKGLMPDAIMPNGKSAFLPLRVLTQQGTVDGCRSRISNSLNRKARAAAGWQEINDLAELDAMLPWSPDPTPWWDRKKD